MNRTAIVYTCPPHIKWVTDETRVIVVNEKQNSHHIFDGAEATIWNWMTLPYAYHKLLPMVAALWSVSHFAAEDRLQQILHNWYADGLLKIDSGEKNGQSGNQQCL